MENTTEPKTAPTMEPTMRSGAPFMEKTTSSRKRFSGGGVRLKNSMNRNSATSTQTR